MMVDLTKFLHHLDCRLQPLSLAVSCANKMSQNTKPLGSVQVSLKDVHKPIIQNPSGYHLFLSLDDGAAELIIKTEYYLEKSIKFKLPDDDLPPEGEKILDFGEVRLLNLAKATAGNEKRGPLLAEVSLMPNVNYPFSAGSTLIYGEIVESDTKKGIADAWIEIESMDIASPPIVLQFHANEHGQFVLYCNQIKRKRVDQPLTILQINGIEFGGGDKIRLCAKSEHFQAAETDVITIIDGEKNKISTIKLNRN